MQLTPRLQLISLSLVMIEWLLLLMHRRPLSRLLLCLSVLMIFPSPLHDIESTVRARVWCPIVPVFPLLMMRIRPAAASTI